MIYASDLDSTLIYARSAIGSAESAVRLIETLNNEEISFMTERAIEQLRGIVASGVTFVPVTTRTIAQYTRISLFQDELVPEYAVVSNGGHIMQYGEPDHEWHESVLARIERECMPWPDLLTKFRAINDEMWVLRNREADGLFHYFIVDTARVPFDRLAEFGRQLEGWGWTMSLQGNKLYFVPEVCNKKAAVQHIMEREDDRRLIASGDSLLDLGFLTAASAAIVPAHGEIYDQHRVGNSIEGSSLHFTSSSGILASEEILAVVQNNIK